MRKFKVTYDHTVFRPHSYVEYKRQLNWSVEIEAENLLKAKEILKNVHHYNHFYFKFEII